jgi:hypothetical protein
VVNGQPVVRSTGYFGAPGGEGGWTISADFPSSSGCYTFRFQTQARAARDDNLAIADKIIESFRPPG